jgi:hypothetical protein
MLDIKVEHGELLSPACLLAVQWLLSHYLSNCHEFRIHEEAQVGIVINSHDSLEMHGLNAAAIGSTCSSAGYISYLVPTTFSFLDQKKRLGVMVRRPVVFA